MADGSGLAADFQSGTETFARWISICSPRNREFIGEVSMYLAVRYRYIYDAGKRLAAPGGGGSGLSLCKMLIFYTLMQVFGIDIRGLLYYNHY